MLATGRELDVALQGDAWLAVQAADGSEAYTRRGDVQLDATGMLTSLIEKWNPILERSFMLGDAAKDAKAGQEVGITGKKIPPFSILAEVQNLLEQYGERGEVGAD